LFSYVEERRESPALDMTWHLAPWDREVFGGDTAAIESIYIKDEIGAAAAFKPFQDWCRDDRIRLVSCRLPHEQIVECGFLEGQGFRFIEIIYRPSLKGLGSFVEDPEIIVSIAAQSDLPEICSIAGQIYETGRLHLDPQVGPEIGNRRYALWAARAFDHPGQTVVKCQINGRIVAYWIVEAPTPVSRYWSIGGLAPGLSGQGLGRRLWRAMLAFHRREGVDEISTSISSHNIAVHNLYASLGFRMSAPSTTLHWCPLGPLKSLSAE
jgi:ribosomal protein S18 acetylase RimI-like enzyme